MAIRSFVEVSLYSIENLDDGTWASADGLNMLDIVIDSLVDRTASDIFKLCRLPLETVEVTVLVGWFVDIFKFASTAN